MKNKTILFVLCLMAEALFSCVPVRFYSDPGLTRETGLKYYPVKPYLQVERDTENGRIVKATILYLPDIADPQYMAVKDGPGSKEVTLKLTDGSLNSFGFSSDPKIADYIESFATLLSKGAGAVKDLNDLKGSQGLKATQNMVELYEFVIGDQGTVLREIQVGDQKAVK